MTALRLPLLCVLASTLALPVTAAVTTIPCLRDNTLYESATGSLSNGAGKGLFAGNTLNSDARRALVFFPVSDSIPMGSTINSVTLRMHITQRQDVTTPLGVHAVLASWGEGTSVAAGNGGGGAPPTSGDATWLHRFHPGQLWNTPGGDFVSVSATSISVNDSGFVAWPSTPAFESLVQDWVDNGGSNFGLLIRGNEAAAGTAQRFESKEDLVSPRRPVLIVDYTQSLVAADWPATGRLGLRVAGAQPARGAVSFSVQLPADGEAAFEIIDARGGLLHRVDQGFIAGEQLLRWGGTTRNGRDAGAGVYFARLTFRGETNLVRFVRLR